MKQYINILLIFIAIMMTGCTESQKFNRESNTSDTLYTADAAMSVYAYNPERALLIIDSAEIVGNLKSDHASFLRARVFTLTYEGERLDSARYICMNLLESNYTKNPENHKAVLDVLVTISRMKHDNEQLLQWATKKADFCREQGDEVEVLRTEAEIGVTLTHLGRQEEGLQKLDYVISQLDGIRKFNEMDACIIAMRRKVNVLFELGQYAEIITLAQKIIEKTNDYEQHPSEFHDDTSREPEFADVPDYCDFYRVKCYAYLALVYANTCDISNARHYLTLFEQSRYGKTLEGQMMITPIMCTLGDYDKMLAIYDDTEQRMGTDTINEIYSSILHDRAVAARAHGNYTQAFDYMSRYASLRQLLNDQLQQSEAHEYAARYRAQEQQIEIERQTMQNRMQNIIILAMFIALLVSVFFYNYTVYQKHKLAARNTALVRLIDERAGLNSLQNDSRVSEACKMLSEKPEMSVSAVAKAVGLPVQSLQKLFREQYGMGLTEYRMSHKK